MIRGDSKDYELLEKWTIIIESNELKRTLIVKVIKQGLCEIGVTRRIGF
jgi:hypothetical protein